MPASPRAAIVLLAAGLGCALSACGTGVSSGPGQGTATPAPSATPTPASSAPPAGEVVLRAQSCCGFAPPWADFATTPTLVVTGDGSVYLPAPVPAIYPGPALSPLVVGHLDAQGVQRVIAEARAAGVTGPAPDFGHAGIADAPVLVVTLTTGGSSAKVSVDNVPPSELSGLTSDERAARQRIFDLLHRIDAQARPGATAFQPTRLGIRASAGSSTDSSSDVRDWPLSTRLVDMACTVLDGADATAVLVAAQRATSQTGWRSGGATFSVVFREMTPGDPGCPS